MKSKPGFVTLASVMGVSPPRANRLSTKGPKQSRGGRDSAHSGLHGEDNANGPSTLGGSAGADRASGPGTDRASF